MHKEMLMLRDSLFTAILTGACNLSVCLVQPSLMGLLLATAALAVAQKGEAVNCILRLPQGSESTVVANIKEPKPPLANR
jgi:hypothetical protein